MFTNNFMDCLVEKPEVLTESDLETPRLIEVRPRLDGPAGTLLEDERKRK